MKLPLVLTLVVLALLPSPPAHAAPGGEPDALATQALFAEEIIPHMRIELSRESLELLRREPRTYVLGAVREGGTLYTNVSIRLKGGPGSYRPLQDKAAFTLNFGRQAPGQRFHGLKKLHLNNSVQDNTYLGEKISRELFDAAGVPAPRAGHAWVQLNDRSLGFYVLIEGIDKHFLKRYFKDTEGTLFDGHSQHDVTTRMERNSGENPDDFTPLRALARAAREPDLNTRLARLQETLDLDRFLSFLATEVMLTHWDGYAMNRNNFRVFHDRVQNRMVFIPQGVDQVFQRRSTSIFPPMSGLVARSVLEIPELRTRYQERMTQLLTNAWNSDQLSERIREVGAKIHASLVQANNPGAATYLGRVSGFERRVQQRVRSLEQILLRPVLEPRFDSNGLLVLTNWEPQIVRGQPILKRDQSDDQATVLHIQAAEESIGSWRCSIRLDRGRYQFQGRVRLENVVLDAQDPKSGAGLRLSRRPFDHPLHGTLPWSTATFDFAVEQDRTEVELVCELRGDQGQAWFDQGSLRLIRQE